MGWPLSERGGSPGRNPLELSFLLLFISSILFLDKNAWALDSGRGTRALDTSAMALA